MCFCVHLMQKRNFFSQSPDSSKLERTVLNMRKFIFQSEPKITSKIREFHSEAETILIPEKYLENLSEEERSALPERIRSLVKKYAVFISSMRRLNSNAGKRKYQKNVGKLKRVNVRMKTGDWLLLGTLAEAHGVSRCFLLNFLLYLESKEVGVSLRKFWVGQPIDHKVYSFIWQLERSQKRISRILRVAPNPLEAPPS
ncbi:DUF1564 domain-containing protein [Leptospira stimsonii]|uniref:DUF1564 domain-containing protein n=2 Tax=Leptospira stimsonii TaxID=2202203 RepID=A0A4R9L8T7_9LEPT|nr:DUF1564 domain-containing protein [Leptospira stimsonii]TGK15473.1 DUF1564 domain-containing protein [Leptospira stimsonii]TGM16515.1 DUF1564 domain-containing protein [Leptospira stimsonii]